MAENTPFYMDINSVYSGDELGLPYRDIMGEGVVAAGDLAVTAGTGNTVNVAAGSAWVMGDTDLNRQPTYRIYNDAVVNKGITPDPTNPRYVRVVAQMNDATFSGATRNWQITTIHGTPAGSPAIPALPASALDLATILVPAAAASSAAYTITDNRVRAKVGGGQAQGGSAMVKLYDSIEAGVSLPGATITTPSLDQTGKNLFATWSVRDTIGAAFVRSPLIRFNGDSAANYIYHSHESNGGTIAMNSPVAQTSINVLALPGASAGAGLYGEGTLRVFDYAVPAGTGKIKICHFTYAAIIGTGATNSIIGHGACYWQAAAVTSISWLAGGTSFAAASRFTVWMEL